MLYGTMRIVAQAGAPGGVDPIQLVVSLVVLIALILGGAAVIVAVRKRLLYEGRDDGEGDDLYSVLQEYKRLRDRGLISGEEYERIRSVIMARASGARMDEVAGLERELDLSQKISSDQEGEDGEVESRP